MKREIQQLTYGFLNIKVIFEYDGDDFMFEEFKKSYLKDIEHFSKVDDSQKDETNEQK